MPGVQAMLLLSMQMIPMDKMLMMQMVKVLMM